MQEKEKQKLCKLFCFWYHFLKWIDFKLQSSGCVWPWVPSPGLILTPTHRLMSQPSLSHHCPQAGAQCPGLGLSLLSPGCCAPWWGGGMVLDARSCPATPGEASVLLSPTALSACNTLAKVIFGFCFIFLLLYLYSVTSGWTEWSHGVYSCPHLRSILAPGESQ